MKQLKKFSIVVMFSVIMVSGSLVNVFAQTNLVLDESVDGRYSEADPDSSGVGEGSEEHFKINKKYFSQKKDKDNSPDVSAAIVNGCNCVIFRLDDLQDYWLSGVQVGVMDQFVQKNKPLSVGPIMNIFGADALVVNKAIAGYNSGLFEVFVHGWNHVDYSKLNLDTQTSTLQQAQTKMQQLFGSKSTVFIPPYNAFNANTLTALKNTEFKIISAAEYTDTYPYFVANGSSNIVDSLGIYHLPESIGFVQYGGSGPIRIPNSQILSAIDSSVNSKGYAVVTLHSQEFAQTVNGNAINAIDQNLISDLNTVINGVLQKNYSIRTFNQVVQYNQSPLPNITINDVTLTEGNSGTKSFVFTVTRSINTPAISVQYKTVDNTATSPSDYTAIPLSTMNFSSGGPLTQTITVSVNGDTIVEPNETFYVNLSNCVGCIITDSQGIGTITNDDSTLPITTASPTGGTYASAQSVILTTNKPATIYYTTNGSTPTTSSTIYTSAIQISSTTTLKFFAVDTSGNIEPVNTLVYTITSGFPIIHMSDTTASSGRSTYSGRSLHTEFITSTSELLGDYIDSITMRFKRVGSPTGIAEIGIFNSDLSVKKLFGTTNSATLPTSYADFTFSLPSGQGYQIVSGDRIGIKFTGGTSTNYISTMIDTAKSDPFDGTNSYHTYYDTTWRSSITNDLYMTLRQLNPSSP